MANLSSFCGDIQLRKLLEQLEGKVSYGMFSERVLSLADSLDSVDADKLWKWAQENIAIDFVPRGKKETAKTLSFIIRFIKVVRMKGKDTEPYEVANVRRDIKNIDPAVFDRYFVIGAGTRIPPEYRGKHALYKNTVGFDEKKLKKVAGGLDSVLGELSGWRAKVLNNLIVVLAGPKFFRGTATGRYSRQEDALYVRATNKVLSRSSRSYASPEYILIHELGHRYDELYGRKFQMYDLSQWTTTPYSMSSDDEAFAELFALGHFGIKKAHREWDPRKQEEFEKRMGS